jgi:hypothetical protein
MNRQAAPAHVAVLVKFPSGHLPDTPLYGLPGHPDGPAPANTCTDSTCTRCYSDVTPHAATTSDHKLPCLHIVWSPAVPADQGAFLCFNFARKSHCGPLPDLTIAITLMSFLLIDGCTPQLQHPPMFPPLACLAGKWPWPPMPSWVWLRSICFFLFFSSPTSSACSLIPLIFRIHLWVYQ